MTPLIIIACLCFLVAPLLWCLGFIWGFVWNKVLKPLMVSESEG
jgi:hypothetical protein